MFPICLKWILTLSILIRVMINFIKTSKEKKKGMNKWEMVLSIRINVGFTVMIFPFNTLNAMHSNTLNHSYFRIHFFKPFLVLRIIDVQNWNKKISFSFENWLSTIQFWVDGPAWIALHYWIELSVCVYVSLCSSMSRIIWFGQLAYTSRMKKGHKDLDEFEKGHRPVLYNDPFQMAFGTRH